MLYTLLLQTPVHANDHEAIFQPRDLEKSPASTTMHVIPSPPSKVSDTIQCYYSILFFTHVHKWIIIPM